MVVHYLHALMNYHLDEEEEALVRYLYLLHLGKEWNTTTKETENGWREQFEKMNIYKEAWLASEHATEREVFRVLLCKCLKRLHKQLSHICTHNGQAL
ncbi:MULTISPECIES: hypothetical protein [Anoxybacillus]|uniref:Uncharacterized protein n=2 Tax=Anoxybacillus TaxID=150247 RepID=M8D7M3_9BACL|nr:MULTISPECIES: hypothetical protein [Anoxybacillus]EMT46801.1 hypothetical protein H919_04087 [Anoxybacillus flavithermus AK1]CUA79234.1 hypothetical protein Ga0061060_10354 [Anoxybacillus suryakundensis]